MVVQTKTQYVWIVRYGLTEYPLVENEGPFDSDIDPNEGIEHANSIGERISRSGDAVPNKVYASPFLRTVHTAHIIAKNALPEPRVRIEEGLTEWQVQSLLVEPNGKRTYPKSAQDHAKVFDSIDLEYQSLNPTVSDDDKDPPKGAPQFPETEENLVIRCSTTIDKILEASKNNENIAIVSHAPCDIGIAVHLEGKSLKESTLEAWPLGGLTLFSRPILNDAEGTYGDWTMEFYGSSEHMPGEYKAGIKRWTLPSLST